MSWINANKNWPSNGSPSALLNDPIYVIGNPRSGTSLLRLMLTCHPDVVIPPESHFFLMLESRFGELSFPDAGQQFIDELFKTRKFETWGIQRQEMQEIYKDLVPRSFREAVALVYCAYGFKRGRFGFRHWGDKNKLWKDKIGRVIHYFPNAKFIHIVRDGRDVACSFKELNASNMDKLKYGPRLPNDVEEIANRWSTNLTFIQDFFRTLEKVNHLTIRFEDLVTVPRETLEAVSAFLQLQFSDEMLNYAQRNKDEELEPKLIMPWKVKLNQQLDKANICKYRHSLTELEIACFENLTESLLRHYGYK